LRERAPTTRQKWRARLCRRQFSGGRHRLHLPSRRCGRRHRGAWQDQAGAVAQRWRWCRFRDNRYQPAGAGAELAEGLWQDVRWDS